MISPWFDSRNSAERAARFASSLSILKRYCSILFSILLWNSDLDFVFLQAKIIQTPSKHCDAPMTLSVLTPKSMPPLTAEVVVVKMVVPPQKYQAQFGFQPDAVDPIRYSMKQMLLALVNEFHLISSRHTPYA